MKAYKVTVLALPLNDNTLESIEYAIENAEDHFLTVMKVEEAEIGEWDDDHPLNTDQQAAYKRYFPG